MTISNEAEPCIEECLQCSRWCAQCRAWLRITPAQDTNDSITMSARTPE
jgi:hypothetical protein